MPSPGDCRFSETHEWFRIQGDVVTLGLSKYAVDELTDITYVEMKPAGTSIARGAVAGEIESVKTTSEIYSAVPGTITEVNKAVIADPSLVNSDPFGAGWLAKIKATDLKPLDALMDNAAYDRKHPVG